MTRSTLSCRCRSYQRWAHARCCCEEPVNLESFPEDVLVYLSTFLDTKADILHVALTSTYVFHSLQVALYASVSLLTTGQCRSTLAMLRRRPDVGRHVRRLHIRPDTAERFEGPSVCDDLRSVVSSLDALQDFLWDGDEAPVHDNLWSTLRRCCHQLRRIGATIGAEGIKSWSSLFNFEDLASFSLTLKGGYHMEDDHDGLLDESSPLYKMLVHRSPNLEYLSILGKSPFTAHPVSSLPPGSWPHLKSLTLGDTFLDGFIAFLEDHPTLEQLQLVGTENSTLDLSPLPAQALPSLRDFSGSVQHIRRLPHREHLHSLHITTPIGMRPHPHTSLVPTLASIHDLTVLDLTFKLKSSHFDDGRTLRAIVNACPRLEALSLVCGRTDTFKLPKVAETLRELRNLRKLEYTTVRVDRSENTLSIARAIVLAHPAIERLSIALHQFARAQFEVRRKVNRSAYALICREHRNESRWTGGRTIAPEHLPCSFDLVPPPEPPKGVMALVMDLDSPSGDEVRLLIATLVVFACLILCVIDRCFGGLAFKLLRSAVAPHQTI